MKGAVVESTRVRNPLGTIGVGHGHVPLSAIGLMHVPIPCGAIESAHGHGP